MKNLYSTTAGGAFAGARSNNQVQGAVKLKPKWGACQWSVLDHLARPSSFRVQEIKFVFYQHRT